MNEHNPNEDSRARSPRRAETWRAILLLVGGFALGWECALGCAPRHGQIDHRLISQAWHVIDSEYVEPSAVDAQKETYAAIQGMVDALGDTGHSTFLTPEMVRQLQAAEKGELQGIGVEIQVKEGRVVVVAPVDGSPAQRAGLHPGDIILKVNGKEIAGLPLEDVVGQITGKPGTSVALTILGAKSGTTRDVNIVRAEIKLKPVAWSMVPGTSVGHVRISGFQNGTTKGLKEALRGLKEHKASGAILDLRSNPGGVLDECVGVASQFLSGVNVLLIKDSNGKITPVPAEKGGVATNLPVVVLVNEGTASASEIVAAAIKDARRGPLVGKTTFGTGTVLGQFQLADGSALLLAVQEWLEPNGKSFWHHGIEPDYEVALPPKTDPLLPENERGMTPAEIRSSGDAQLLKALELLGAE